MELHNRYPNPERKQTMQTTPRRTASLEAKPVSELKIANWKQRVDAETKRPVLRGVAELEAAMDAYAANLAKPEPPHVMGGKFDFSKPFALLAKELGFVDPAAGGGEESVRSRICRWERCGRKHIRSRDRTFVRTHSVATDGSVFEE